MNNVIALHPTDSTPVVLAGALIPRLQAMNFAARGLRQMGLRILRECLNTDGRHPIITIEPGGVPLGRLFNQGARAAWADKGYVRTIYRGAIVMWRMPA